MVSAVILAAGLGRRITTLTNGGPKALLELNGVSLLERSIDALEAAGFREVVVVTGHAAQTIRSSSAIRGHGLTVTERWNPEFDTGNNIVSMLSAADLLVDGFTLLNCDIVFEPSILVDIAPLDAGNWLVVDGDEPLGDEEMKVTLDDRGAVARISKGLDASTAVGEYIGIARFDAPGAALLFETARTLVADGGRNLYYEDAIDSAASGLTVNVLWTRGRPWTEIDDDVDYERALTVAAALDGRPVS